MTETPTPLDLDGVGWYEVTRWLVRADDAEAFADAWARTHHKASLVPLGNDTYRVVGAMRRSAVTGRYLTSADKGE